MCRVMAVSATHLKGVYFEPTLRALYAELLTLHPRQVLGGSIYLYDFPFKEPNGAATTAPAP